MVSTRERLREETLKDYKTYIKTNKMEAELKRLSDFNKLMQQKLADDEIDDEMLLKKFLDFLSYLAMALGASAGIENTLKEQ